MSIKMPISEGLSRQTVLLMSHDRVWFREDVNGGFDDLLAPLKAQENPSHSMYDVSVFVLIVCRCGV